jgi:hypothetical protein
VLNTYYVAGELVERIAGSKAGAAVAISERILAARLLAFMIRDSEE